MDPSHEGSIRRPVAPRANALTTEELHLAPRVLEGSSNIAMDRASDVTRYVVYPAAYEACEGASIMSNDYRALSCIVVDTMGTVSIHG